MTASYLLSSYVIQLPCICDGPLSKRRKKQCRKCKHYQHAWIRKGCFLVFCTTQWMQRHTTSHIENKTREAFQWGSGGRSLRTTRSIAQMFLRVVLTVSFHLYDFVADLIAFRLNFSMSACRPVILRLWSGFLVWLLQMVPVALRRMV